MKQRGNQIHPATMQCSNWPKGMKSGFEWAMVPSMGTTSASPPSQASCSLKLSDRKDRITPLEGKLVAELGVL